MWVQSLAEGMLFYLYDTNMNKLDNQGCFFIPPHTVVCSSPMLLTFME